MWDGPIVEKAWEAGLDFWQPGTPWNQGLDTLLHMSIVSTLPLKPARASGETPAQTLLKRAGERPTPARLAVLDILLDTPRALTHHEIAAAARQAGSELDRVTLYRVLDWLVEKALAHKIAGEDRVWRFNALAGEPLSQAGAHEHAHFQCSRCGRLYCLDGLRPAFAFTLPPGFRCDHAELILRGLCPDCGGRADPGRGPGPGSAPPA